MAMVLFWSLRCLRVQGRRGPADTLEPRLKPLVSLQASLSPEREEEEANLLLIFFFLPLFPSFLVVNDTTLPISSLVPGGQ